MRGVVRVSVSGSKKPLYVTREELVALRAWHLVGWFRKEGFFSAFTPRAELVAFLEDLRGQG